MKFKQVFFGIVSSFIIILFSLILGYGSLFAAENTTVSFIENTLSFKSLPYEKNAYMAYYIHGNTVEGVRGKVEGGNVQVSTETCSMGYCREHDIQRGILKVQNDNSPYDRFFFEVTDGQVQIIFEKNGNQFDLTSDEELWLHEGFPLTHPSISPSFPLSDEPDTPDIRNQKPLYSAETPEYTQDATPITGTDGSTVIVVDATGSDMINDGKTTIMEARAVVHTLPNDDIKKIVFCIPDGNGGDTTGLDGLLPGPCGAGAADPNYNVPGYEERWLITFPGSRNWLTTDNVQILANQTYNWMSPGDYPDPSAKPRILLNNTTRLRTSSINNLVLKGLKFIGDSVLLADTISPSDDNEGHIVGGIRSLDRNVFFNNGRKLWMSNGPKDVTVQGNFIGIDDDGLTQKLPLIDYSFILSERPKNALIGGPGLARNYMAGGSKGTVLITGPGSGQLANNVINNYIGLGYDGQTVFPSTIGFATGAYGGGEVIFEDNIVVGADIGVEVGYSSVEKIIFKRNIIGLDAYGNAAPNRVGISIKEGSQPSLTTDVIIGSTDEVDANIISGNLETAFEFSYAPSSITFGRNLIGKGFDGTTDIPNSLVFSFSTAPVVTLPLDVSLLTISHEHTHIVSFDTQPHQGISVLPISSNTALRSVGIPIDIQDPAENAFNLNANDAGDGDTGPNDLMNHPLIETVTYEGGGTYRIEGTVDNEQTAEKPITIDICESYENENTPGYGGCARYLGQATSTSPWETTVTMLGDDGTTKKLFSAWATNANGSSSEFGPNFRYVPSEPEPTSVPEVTNAPTQGITPTEDITPTVSVQEPQPTLYALRIEDEDEDEESDTNDTQEEETTEETDDVTIGAEDNESPKLDNTTMPSQEQKLASTGRGVFTTFLVIAGSLLVLFILFLIHRKKKTGKEESFHFIAKAADQMKGKYTPHKTK